MSIVKDIEIPFSTGEIERIVFPLLENDKENRFSIFIGENGTRKSYLLRAVLDCSMPFNLNNEYVNLGILRPSTVVKFNRHPSKIMAVSAAPTDRFPSKSAASDKIRNSKYNIDEYAYVGPRTAGNIISRNQSIDEVIAIILKNPKILLERNKIILEVIKQLDLKSNFLLGLDISMRTISGGGIEGYISRRLEETNVRVNSKVREKINGYLSFLDTKKGKKFTKEIEDIVILNGSQRNKRRITAHDYPFIVDVNILDGKLNANGITLDALNWAVEIGYLKPGRITFQRINGDVINQDDLSAGQWSLFSTITSLTLSVQDNTLILIDEPESGLHPAWQRTFLDTLMRAISYASGCHVLIATHSPLVLSSMNPKVSDLITLTRNSIDGNISASMEIPPAGWDASLILQDMFDLEDSRSPHLTDLVDSALSLIAKGLKGNKTKLNILLPKIKVYFNSLPDHDIGKGVLASIIKIVEGR